MGPFVDSVVAMEGVLTTSETVPVPLSSDVEELCRNKAVVAVGGIVGKVCDLNRGASELN